MGNKKQDKLLRYRMIRDDIDTFDRLEWRSNSLLGKAIRLKTGDWSNHTGIVIRFHEYDAAGLFTIESLEGGVDPNRLSLRLSEFNGSVRLYKLKPEYHHLRSELGEAALSMEGIKYDYGSLVKNLFGHVTVNKKRLFCSEFVKAVGIKAGLPHKNLIAPTPGKEMNMLGWWDLKYINLI